MNLLACLFIANKFVQCDQGRVGWNGLPLAHDALRVNNFTGQHGATVHGKLQNMHKLFAAVHFHVSARRHKVGAALSFLGGSVIEQAPERTNGAVSFDGTVVDVNNTGIGGGHPLPFSESRLRSQKHQKQQGQSHTPLNSSKAATFGYGIFKGVCKWVHALYYKVAQPS